MNAFSRAAPALMLDISRLLSRCGEAAPTGIDKVELAYAEYLAAQHPARGSFAALHPLGAFGVLPFEAASRFIALLSSRWRNGGDSGAVTGARRLLQRHLLFAADRARPDIAAGSGRVIYLLLSHHHLARPAIIAKILGRRPITLAAMLHDTIPIDYPEYARPNEPAKHLQRIETAARFASIILTPSEMVRQNILPHLTAAGRAHVPVHVLRHGVNPALLAGEPRVMPVHPYFVCLGTIEPRKNHLLLLNIWRRLVETRGKAAPKLLLIGRRGWENENIIDMIERCATLRGVVQEINGLPDRQVVRLLKGASALLMPSFAEGYGLPLAEALALRVPVICSDIDIFREVGGAAPVYLDPLDGLGWLRLIERYANGHHAEPPTWPAIGWPASIEAGLHALSALSTTEKIPELSGV